MSNTLGLKPTFMIQSNCYSSCVGVYLNTNHSARQGNKLTLMSYTNKAQYLCHVSLTAL